MLSSYNIIKSVCVEKSEKKPIDTDISIINKRNNEIDEFTSKEHYANYENLAKDILENARKQKDEILQKSYNECVEMETKAKDKIKKEYNNAAESGYKDGFQKAYKEYYKKNIEKAKKDSEALIKNAENIMQSAKDEYNKYLDEKESDIMELVFKAAQSILKKEVKDKDALNGMIFDALSKEKGKGKFIIRCNKCYEESIKSNIADWKNKLALKNDIFIVPDAQIEQGKAIIEKEDGKTIIDIDNALEKLKEVLLNA